jgi:hypothetical protein
MKKTISTPPSIALHLKRQHLKENLDLNLSTMTFSPSQLLKVVTVHSGLASLEGATRANMDDDDEGDADEDSLPADTPVTSGGGLNTPDYEHLLNVISDGFNKLIATFYNNNASAIIGASLARVKESYEEIINSIVENLSQ